MAKREFLPGSRSVSLKRSAYGRPLNKKFINGEVGWGKIEVVANIATKENEKVWSDRLETMSFGALRALIKDSFVHEAIDIPDPYEIFRMKLRKDTLSRLRVLKQRLEKKNKHPLTWDDTVIEIVKRVKEKAPRPGRGISIAEFREMHKVFKGLCAFPGCEKPAEHIHHPERYALTRSHKNIKPMCKAHHEIAHHGLIENEEKDPKQWKISDQPQTDDAKRKIDQKYLNHRAKFLSDRQSSSP